MAAQVTSIPRSNTDSLIPTPICMICANSDPRSLCRRIWGSQYVSYIRFEGRFNMVPEWHQVLLIVIILVYSAVQGDNANENIVAARVEVSVMSV